MNPFLSHFPLPKKKKERKKREKTKRKEKEEKVGGAQSLKAVSAFLMVVPGVRLLAHGLFGPLPLVWSAELNSLDLKYVFNLYLSYTYEHSLCRISLTHKMFI